MADTIPFNNLARQYSSIRQELLDVTDKIMSTGNFMDGGYTKTFETWLAKRNHVNFAATCHSGTQALEIMAAYLRTQYPVDQPPRVAIPAMTYSATANAFATAGWNIVFVDVDRYGVIDAAKVPSNIDLVVTVGLFGARVPDIMTNRRIMTVEDAAQNWLGANSHRTGHASAISFDPVKNLANYGNGGAIVTNDGNFASWIKSYRNNGKNSSDCGTNSRMSEIDCAQLMVKANYVDVWQTRRGQIADYLISRLSSRVRCLIDETNRQGHGFQKFVIEVNNRDQLRQQLTQSGIETRIHYDQPLNYTVKFKKWPGVGVGSQADQLSKRLISLPFYPELTDAEIDRIADQVLSCV